jgi:L-aminopeptidase/D-esterase-like protein
VVRAPTGALRGGVAIAGRATGSRELHALSPDHLVDRIDAVLLTGGSAYGLDAAAGVMRWMEEHDRGFPVGPGVVPIVPAAVIFDLAPLGRFDARPTPAMAHDACENAATSGIAEGSVGVGTGATVGKALGPDRVMKGGFGCTLVSRGDTHVAALAAVNAFGDVRDAKGDIIAGARAEGGRFGDSAAIFARNEAVDRFDSLAGRNTTLAIVATNIGLDRKQLEQLARGSIAAMNARITPCGTRFDGDIVFALCPADAAASAPESVLESVTGMAVEALAMAIERAVRLASGRDGIPGLADRTRRA